MRTPFSGALTCGVLAIVFAFLASGAALGQVSPASAPGSDGTISLDVLPWDIPGLDSGFRPPPPSAQVCESWRDHRRQARFSSSPFVVYSPLYGFISPFEHRGGWSRAGLMFGIAP